jgi:signal transduction histidine kinase
VQLGVQTAVWVPVVGDTGVEAVLLLARCRVQPYPQTDLDLLGAMAYRIAVMLERSRAETRLREAQDRLLQTERLALAGKLSGSMAHELNNPLAAVRSNLEQLHGQLPTLTGVFRTASRARALLATVPGSEAAAVVRDLDACLEGSDAFAADVEEILGDSVESVRRMGQLVGSLLRLSAAEHFDPELLDLRVAVAECVADLPPDTGRPALQHEPGDGTPCMAWIAAAALKVALTGVIRMVLSPGLHRTDPARSVLIRVEQYRGRPAVVVTDPVLVLEEEERRAIFDPRMEEVETPRGRTVRLSLMATLSYQLFRGCGAEVSTETLGEEGLTVRVVLPAVPGVGP